ncbi:hypothetical protein PIIN_05766 [Serendipita indica DSM 11827]|uniref:Uncharacterized protein n=1 Tax=Serendipita indica (strain DSM 11827) TaxID=1109443 RepID=G4TKI3_SERID|nr:hypothetical protein PIIN_05766 [Serendipita indica DSM 11827]
MDDLYARFNPNPNKIAAWGRLLMLSDDPSGGSSTASSVPSPDELYTRAIPTLLQMKDDLVRLGWSEIPTQDVPEGLLFVVESPKPAAGNLCDEPSVSPSEPSRLSSPFFLSTSVQSRSSFFHDLPRSSDPVRFALPADLSGFLEFRREMEEALHNPELFRPILDHRGNLVLASSHDLDPLNSPPLKNIFHLLQLIVPGMFLLVHDSLSFTREKSLSLRIPDSRSGSQRQSRQGTLDSMGSTRSTQVFLRRTRRALPPAEWISNRLEVLETIFGKHHLHNLIDCARDVELTVWRTVHGPEDQMDTGYVNFDSNARQTRVSHQFNPPPPLVRSDAGFDVAMASPIIPSPTWSREPTTQTRSEPILIPSITPGATGERPTYQHVRARSL